MGALGQKQTEPVQVRSAHGAVSFDGRDHNGPQWKVAQAGQNLSQGDPAFARPAGHGHVGAAAPVVETDDDPAGKFAGQIGHQSGVADGGRAQAPWEGGLPEPDPAFKYREPGPGMPGYRGPRDHRYGGETR